MSWQTFDPADQILHINLKGRDPDEGTTEVPYIKGSLFLRQIEQVFGRATFDGFLKKYFDHFSFQSITTATMLDYLNRELFSKHPDLAKQIPVNQWVFDPGLPASAPKAVSERLEKVGETAKRWVTGQTKVSQIQTKHWSTQEWLEFLQVLPSPLKAHQMAELDRTFHLTQTGNSEMLDQWLKMAIAARYEPAYPRLRVFLMDVGRQKFIKPLYAELMKTPHGRTLAERSTRGRVPVIIRSHRPQWTRSYKLTSNRQLIFRDRSCRRTWHQYRRNRSSSPHHEECRREDRRIS